MMKLLSWIGSILLSLCALPQAYDSYKQKSSKGISWTFLLMWFFGELLTFLFVLSKKDMLQLICNYGLNIIFISIIIYYKVKDLKNDFF